MIDMREAMTISLRRVSGASAWPAFRNPETKMDSHPSSATVIAVAAAMTAVVDDTDVARALQGERKVVCA
jgi:hypothetical protein